VTALAADAIVETLPPDALAGKNGEAAAARSGARGRVHVAMVTFEKVRLLVGGDVKPADRDGSLRLGTDGLQVVDGGKTIHSTAYRDVIGLFHSHSREPRWATPDGTAVPVAKVGSKFGFLKTAPDWITVRTKKAFIPLRVQDGDLGRVIAELEARTGTKIVRTR
jgi:hypothetical protein